MMKLSKIIPLLILPFISSGCSYNHFIIVGRVNQVHISDMRKAYAVDDVFADECDFTITAKYNNGNIKNFALADMDECHLTYVKDGKTIEQDINEKFTVRGDYSFYTVLDGIKSNVIPINVLEHHIYVESMSLSGSDMVNVKSSTSLTLEVNPSDYTSAVEYSVSDPYLAQISKTTNGISIFALKAGTLTVTASSLKSETEIISTSFDLTILPVYNTVKMEETYKDYSKYNAYGSYYAFCPSIGNPRLLVIPVWFNDSSSIITKGKDRVREDIEKAYFGTPEEVGWHSVSSYYNYESHGKVNLTGTVSRWYESGVSYKVAGGSSYNTANLVNSAVSWYFTNNPSDSRRNYDYDNDGVMDGVMLIYAAPDSSNSGFYSYQNLWAYCSWFSGTQVDGVRPCVYFWASYDFMYDPNTAQVITGNYYGHGDNNYCTIDSHTFIHEMGHVFGLDDYYDYSGQYNPAGGFSMQDYNVGGHDPYSSLALGWTDAIIPTETQTIIISEYQYTHDLILLSPSFNEYHSPYDEYLLLELYSPNGVNKFDSDHKYGSRYPQGPRIVGVRLWHIDARLAVWTGSKFRLADSCTVRQSNILTAMTNTYKSDGEAADRISRLGEAYADYNILQLIRNNILDTYRPTDSLEKNDLFVAGDSFSMKDYSRQFVNGTQLNSSKTFPWTFKVNSIELENGLYSASITLTKN